MLPFILTLFAGLESTPPVAIDADIIRFKARQALVSDAAGIPLFIGTRDFVLKKAHNETGTVVAYDPSTKRVRVSTIGTELWLSCAELESMASSCAQQSVPRRRLRGAEQSPGDYSMIAARVPSCPGDPRCPKID